MRTDELEKIDLKKLNKLRNPLICVHTVAHYGKDKACLSCGSILFKNNSERKEG